MYYNRQTGLHIADPEDFEQPSQKPKGGCRNKAGLILLMLTALTLILNSL